MGKNLSRRIHLGVENYVGLGAYFVTICCDRRHAVFKDEERGKWVVAEFRRMAAKHEFDLPAYCAMPDHVHLLAQARSSGCDLKKFVAAFKQRSAFEYARCCNRRLWQPRYYEHILRRGEDMEDVALYIWNNPVRAGVCARAVEYPFSGSTTTDWRARYKYAGDWYPSWKRERKEQG